MIKYLGEVMERTRKIIKKKHFCCTFLLLVTRTRRKGLEIVFLVTQLVPSMQRPPNL